MDRDAAGDVLLEHRRRRLGKEQTLDALEGCVWPVPPATIDRDAVALEIRRFASAVVSGTIPNTLSIADRILALVVPDPRFDAIRQLHYTDPDNAYACIECRSLWPCATVRALDGETPT